MAKPRFANRWYDTPRVNELRQEIQNIYSQFLPVISGAADSTDDDGNPTPNTTDFSASRYEDGTLFYATSYPDDVDGGSMQFQVVDGVWVWRWGSYRADSSFSGIGSGTYWRDANGRQGCDDVLTLTYNSASDLRTDWVYPAQFTKDTVPNIEFTNYSLPGTGAQRIFVEHVGAITDNIFARPQIRNDLDNPYVSGNTADIAITATGFWK